MTFNLPFKSTRNTFSGLNVQGSATISEDAYVSGSLNAITIGSFPVGEGLKLDHGTISSTVTGGGGGSTLFAGPGISIQNSTIINTGTLAPGSGVTIQNGTVASTIPQGISTLVAGSGISVNGNTITNTGTLTAGSGIDIGGGTISSTVAGGSASVIAGTNVQVGGGTVSVIDNPSFVGIDITSSTISMGSYPTFRTTDNALGYRFFVGGTQVAGIAPSTTYGGIRGYASFGTLHANAINGGAIPIGSGLAEASGTIYATGGVSSGTVSAYEVLSPSNTLTLEVTTVSVGSIISSTIEIANTQSTSSTAPFQQMLQVDLSSVGLDTYVNATLTNIQFSDTSGATIIPSWRESGTVTTDTLTYWVLLEQGIPASSTLLVQLNVFTNKDSVLNASDTGLAPTLPQYYNDNYGSNDTGTIVFGTVPSGMYDNFAGTLLDNDWQVLAESASLAYTVNDGLILHGHSSANGVNQGIHVYTASTIHVNIIDALIPYTYQEINVDWEVAFNTSQVSTVVTNDGGFVDSMRYDAFPQASSTLARVLYDLNGGGHVVTNANASSLTGLWTSVWTPAGNEILAQNYATLINATNTGLAFADSQIDLAMINGTIIDSTIVYQWARSRAYPPNGIMPSVSYSSPTTSEPVIKFPSGATFINPPTGTITQSQISPLPTIWISAYGTTNSTSTIKNNGMDFGPDTPNTTTYGIKEAFDYCENTATQSIKIRFTSGAFYLDDPVFVLTHNSYDIGGIYGNWNASSSTDDTIDPSAGTFILPGPSFTGGQFLFTFGGTLFNGGHLSFHDMYIRGINNLTYAGGEPTGALAGGLQIYTSATINSNNETHFVNVDVYDVKFNVCAPGLHYQNLGGPQIFRDLHFTMCTAGTISGTVLQPFQYDGGSGYLTDIEMFETYGAAEIALNNPNGGEPDSLLRVNNIGFLDSLTTSANFKLDVAGDVAISNIHSKTRNLISNSAFINANSTDLVSLKVSNVQMKNRSYLVNITQNPAGPMVFNNIAFQTSVDLVGTVNATGINPSSPVLMSNLAWVSGSIGAVGSTLTNLAIANAPQIGYGSYV